MKIYNFFYKFSLKFKSSIIILLFVFFFSAYIYIQADADYNEYIIDVHVHAQITHRTANTRELVDALKEPGVGITVLMPFPTAIMSQAEVEASADDLVLFFSSYPDNFYFMYGGSELQPILHAIGRPGSFILDEVYPNGSAPDFGSVEDMEEMNSIRANQTEWIEIFKQRALEAAQSGKYIGFGELAPLHYSLKQGHPYMHYPADHELMLWLSDLAAEYNMVLDIHMEATEDSVQEFINLLKHNPETKIIWDHIGWGNTG